jgi:hypothetical protein
MDLKERIQARAHQLWVNEGRPEGRAEAHWDMASELVAIEDNYNSTLLPISKARCIGPTGEPVEPIEALRNQGDFPTLTDQGDRSAGPASHAPQRKTHGNPDNSLVAPTLREDAVPTRSFSTSGGSLETSLLLWGGMMLVGTWLLYCASRKRRPRGAKFE